MLQKFLLAEVSSVSIYRRRGAVVFLYLLRALAAETRAALSTEIATVPEICSVGSATLHPPFSILQSIRKKV